MSGGWTLEAGASPWEEPRAAAREQDDGRVDAAAPDVGILSVAIELADQSLHGLSLPRGAYAGLLSDLYEGVRLRMPYRELMDFARATALHAAQEAGTFDGARSAGTAGMAAEAQRDRAAG